MKLFLNKLQTKTEEKLWLRPAVRLVKRNRVFLFMNHFIFLTFGFHSKQRKTLNSRGGLWSGLNENDGRTDNLESAELNCVQGVSQGHVLGSNELQP